MIFKVAFYLSLSLLLKVKEFELMSLSTYLVSWENSRLIIELYELTSLIPCFFVLTFQHSEHFYSFCYPHTKPFSFPCACKRNCSHQIMCSWIITWSNRSSWILSEFCVSLGVVDYSCPSEIYY